MAEKAQAESKQLKEKKQCASALYARRWAPAFSAFATQLLHHPAMSMPNAGVRHWLRAHKPPCPRPAQVPPPSHPLPPGKLSDFYYLFSPPGPTTATGRSGKAEGLRRPYLGLLSPQVIGGCWSMATWLFDGVGRPAHYSAADVPAPLLSCISLLHPKKEEEKAGSLFGAASWLAKSTQRHSTQSVRPPQHSAPPAPSPVA
jgi:hypothetical protein